MKKHYRPENNCLNCGAILKGKYCYNCGQENLEIKESFGHMMNHAVSDYFHFDHQFFHTIKPLLFKPGYLTNEYIAGRRVQYLHPVKMYIFISIVYFLLLFQTGNNAIKVNNMASKPVNTQKVIDSLNNEIANEKGLSPNQKKAIGKNITRFSDMGENKKNGESKTFAISGDSTVIQYTDDQLKLSPEKRDGFFKKNVYKKLIGYHEKYGQRAEEVFNEQLQHNLPKIMFVLLPLFALILGITFRKNKKFYVEHLIYAFHLHCFLFLFWGVALIMAMAAPNSWGLNQWIMLLAGLYTAWYFYKSLRIVYHRGAFRTITKLIGVTVTYLLAYTICFVLLIMITAITIT